MVRSAALVGIDAIEVRVEASLAGGLPAVHIVGLPDTAVREAKERVRAALRSCGATLPPSRVVVNLAPADVRKEGPGFDLPIALALLAAQARLPAGRLEQALAVGELGLDGVVRPVRGLVAIAVLAQGSGCRSLLVPASQGHDTAWISGIEVVPVASLADAVAWCRGLPPTDAAAHLRSIPAPPTPPATGAAGPRATAGDPEPLPDLADVHGQAVAKRALEIAAAGGHHLLLVGPPGGGKSMLARRLPGLLPPLDDRAALDVARLHSVAGLARRPTDRHPPFRDPHHASSLSGLLGTERGPGELSLAHRGVLFLDELPEFDRRTLEALRQPLEDGRVVLARARARIELPASFQLLAAMNPCPCGFDGDEERPCRCHPTDRRRYRGRLSGPLLDRFDLRLRVPRLAREAVAYDRGAPSSSAAVALRVAGARAQALARQGAPNAALRRRALERLDLDAPASALLEAARRRGTVGERGTDQLLRVARTVADLAADERIRDRHVAEALALRWEPHPVDAPAAAVSLRVARPYTPPPRVR